MAQEEAGSLPEVLARVGAAHGIPDLAQKLHFYDQWAPDYDQLQAQGFFQLHGVDGSPEMLKQARARGLYQCLRLCTLGQEPLPSPEGTFDAVLIVGALSDGQVPCSVIPELLRVTKPGEEQPSQPPSTPATILLPLCTAQTQAPEPLRPSDGQRPAQGHTA
nr:Williams-Beuren syndrome chromosomal region 27 protein isoform X4 [Aotus nancymaae]